MRTTIGLPLIAAVLWAPLASVSAAIPDGTPVDATPAEGRDQVKAHSLTVINHASRRIESVRLSSSKSSQYGDDLLGEDTIDPNGRAVLSYKGPCRSDMQINFEGGATESRRYLDICMQTSFVIEAGWTLAPQVGSGK